jgi:hypothetical protein
VGRDGGALVGLHPSVALSLDTGRLICTQGALRESTKELKRSRILGLAKPRSVYNGVGMEWLRVFAGEMLVILYTNQNTSSASVVLAVKGDAAEASSVCSRGVVALRYKGLERRLSPGVYTHTRVP